MDKETKDALEGIGGAFNEMKTLVEAGTFTAEKKARIDAILDGSEEVSAKLLKISEDSKANADEVVELKKALEEAKVSESKIREQVDALEAEQIKRKISGNGDGKDYSFRETEEYKSLEFYCQKGNFNGYEGKATLRTDDQVSGGVMVVPEMDTMITKEIVEISQIRQVARVRSTNNQSLKMVIRKGIPVATYEGEAGTASESISNYGAEEITTYRLTHISPVTIDLLMNSQYPMENEILSDGAEAFAQGEGLNFVTGTGFQMPEGFVQDALLQAAAFAGTGSTGVMEPDDIIRMTGELKSGQNPMFALNRKTVADLRSKRSASGGYLWQPGLNGVVGNSIAGFPYITPIDMPDIAAGAFSVAFADFRRGYTILDRTGLTIIRDDVTAAADAIVKFTLHRYNTGRIILREAFKLLQIKA